MCFVDDYLPKPVTREAMERMLVWWIVRGRSEVEELNQGGGDNGMGVPDRGLRTSQREDEVLRAEAEDEWPDAPRSRCILM
jgi:hypothetical protein